VRRIAVIGAPSSAGSYARGQEDGPAALRDAGLLEALADAGADVVDLGDAPRFAWRPDRASPRAMHAGPVRRTALAVAERVAAARDDGRVALVLGGDCTIELGAVRAFPDAVLAYFDPHPDLNTPETVPDGALDWMGVAHLLDLPGAVDEVAGLGPRRPLLDPARLLLFGWDASGATGAERGTIARLGLARVPEPEVARDPRGAAAAAVGRLPAGPRLVHFDVDAVDFADAPLAENTARNVHLPLDAALAALGALAAGDALASVCVTELNPHHAAAEPGLLARFARGLAGAVAVA
jgi:arginase